MIQTDTQGRTTTTSYDRLGRTLRIVGPDGRMVVDAGLRAGAREAAAPPGPTAKAVQTLRVPADRPTIQAGIDAALPGDTVLVAPGTYNERIDFNGKAITVTSEAGAATTIIDGGQGGEVVLFSSGEPRAAVLNGFTLRNGLNTSFGGGGVTSHFASPTITNNIITGNQGCAGVGISAYQSGVSIRGNVIRNNVSTQCSGGSGIGIEVTGDDDARGLAAEIIGNVIENNRTPSGYGGGVDLSGAGAVLLLGNIVRNNLAEGISPCSRGGGLSISNVTPARIHQNLFVGNTATNSTAKGCGGALYWLVPDGQAGPDVANNVFHANSASDGGAIYAAGTDASASLVNNIFSGVQANDYVFCAEAINPATPAMRGNNLFGAVPFGGVCPNLIGTQGNIAADPKFANAGAGDFHLLAGSPSIDTGSAHTGLPATDYEGKPRIADADGNGTATVDMGIYEFPAAVVTFTDDFEGRQESGVPAPLTAQLSRVLGFAVTVPLLRSGAATPGDDYSSPASIVIPAGSTSAGITITPIDDTRDEPQEVAIFDMGTVQGAVPGAITRFRLSFADNDPLPSVAFTAGAQTAAEAAGSVTVTAQLSAASGRTVTVPLALGGTASANGVDYSAPVKITIPAGASGGQATVSIVDDALDELSENAVLTMGTLTNATAGAVRKHTLTIADNDPLPTVTFAKAAQSVAEDGGMVALTAKLSVPSGRPVTVTLSRAGTAADGADYGAAAEIVIPAGRQYGSIDVSIADDATDEPNETVTFRIESSAGAIEGAARTQVLTILDND